MAADLESGFEQHRKPTRREEFLKTMQAIVPWSALCEVIEPYYPKAGTSANVHDKHPLPCLLHGNEARVCGDSAYASQKGLIQSKALNAKDFTNQRTKRTGAVDEVKRAKNRSKSRYRGLQKNATRAFTALALANIYLGRMRLLAQVRP